MLSCEMAYAEIIYAFVDIKDCYSICIKLIVKQVSWRVNVATGKKLLLSKKKKKKI